MNVSVASGYRRARTRSVSGSSSLLWSEYLFIVAVVISEFILTIDPLEWNVNRITALKHLPLTITLAAVTLTACGRRLQYGPSRTSSLAQVLRVAWPLAALAAFIVLGSLYARLGMGNLSTFLNLGVYMGLVVVTAVMLIESSNPDALLRWYMGVLVIGAVIMGAYIVHNFGVREVYHEQIFMVIPIAIWFVTALRNRVLAWIGAIGMMGLAFFSAKNTSYLVLLMTGLYIVWQQGLPRVRKLYPVARGFAYYLLTMLLLVTASIITFVWMNRERYLPSGNVEYRSHTYGMAWDKFLDSPLWGTAFAEASVKKFSLYSIEIAGGVLPTHSDIMDLLANGGLTAAVLWLLGMFLVARRTRRWLMTDSEISNRWAHYAHTLIGVSAAGILTYSFNPVLLEPGMAYMAWAAIGLLIGMSVIAEPDSRVERARRVDDEFDLKKGQAHA